MNKPEDLPFYLFCDYTGGNSLRLEKDCPITYIFYIDIDLKVFSVFVFYSNIRDIYDKTVMFPIPPLCTVPVLNQQGCIIFLMQEFLSMRTK